MFWTLRRFFPRCRGRVPGSVDVPDQIEEFFEVHGLIDVLGKVGDQLGQDGRIGILAYDGCPDIERLDGSYRADADDELTYPIGSWGRSRRVLGASVGQTSVTRMLSALSTGP